MERIIEYDDYRNNLFPKIQLVIPFLFENDKIYMDLTIYTRDLFFEIHRIQDYKGKENTIQIDYNRPTIYYCARRSSGKLWLDSLSEENLNKVYGRPLDSEGSFKIEINKRLGDKDYIPKTVYDKNKIRTLKLPIIAKPSGGFQGRGIRKFDSYEELESSNNSFDIFSEYIKHIREFRCYVFNDKIYSIDERILNDMEGINDKEIDDHIKFVYIQQKIENFPYLNQFQKIVNDSFNVFKGIGVHSVDILVDKEQKCWFVEVNQTSGMEADIIAMTYIPVYETFYGKSIPKYIMNKINEVNVKQMNLVKQYHLDAYNKSIMPLL